MVFFPALINIDKSYNFFNGNWFEGGQGVTIRLLDWFGQS